MDLTVAVVRHLLQEKRPIFLHVCSAEERHLYFADEILVSQVRCAECSCEESDSDEEEIPENKALQVSNVEELLDQLGYNYKYVHGDEVPEEYQVQDDASIWIKIK